MNAFCGGGFPDSFQKTMQSAEKVRNPVDARQRLTKKLTSKDVSVSKNAKVSAFREENEVF